jgi:multidrug efflux pump subunit AcrA (membrane-fusion protein)
MRMENASNANVYWASVMADLKADLDALRIDRELEPSGRRPWRWLIAVALLAAAAFGAWRWAIRERPVPVDIAAVSQRGAGTQAAVLNASGYVTARRRATVSSKVTGKVIEVNVEEGMAVREGQVLARLDASTAQAALALAEAQAEAARRSVRESEVRLEDARRTLRRRTELVQERLVTEADLDTARADVESLEARIVAARAQVAVAERQIEVERTNLDNAVIKAPFSGVAFSKDALPGYLLSRVWAGWGFTRRGICTLFELLWI